MGGWVDGWIVVLRDGWVRDGWLAKVDNGFEQI
jgi:hypothetical protein